MPSRNNRKVTYLTDEESASLSEWADEVGKSESALLREAVLEYLDHDRTARLDEKLDRVLDILDDTEHTHTSTPSKASSTVEKGRSIARRIHNNHESPVKTVDVERAIEDIAGADDRTLDKYKELLKKRGLLYRHPSESPVWTDDRHEWVGWVEDYIDATPSATIYDYVDDYGMSTEEYEQVADEVTQ